MSEFVAIDFETANEHRRSACAVGLAHFAADGSIARRMYRLLRPHPEVDYFNPINSWLHGIEPAMVENAPQWVEVHQEVQDFIGERPIVAHNMAFDGAILSDLSALYQLPAITNQRCCTLRLARRILANQIERKSLDAVYSHYFPGESFTHHAAGADAEACGKIFARMLCEYGLDELIELSTTPAHQRRGGQVRLTAGQLPLATLKQQYGNSQVLRGERVVFTGKLKRAPRAIAMELVEHLGGIADKTLTKKTTLLVVGVPNPRAWAAGSSASRKLQKATQLRAAGSPIAVMSEEEFFYRLGD